MSASDVTLEAFNLHFSFIKAHLEQLGFYGAHCKILLKISIKLFNYLRLLHLGWARFTFNCEFCYASFDVAHALGWTLFILMCSAVCNLSEFSVQGLDTPPSPGGRLVEYPATLAWEIVLRTTIHFSMCVFSVWLFLCVKLSLKLAQVE